MKYFVDAWLERFDPIVRLLDAASGRTVVEWRGEEVRCLIAEGTLDVADLANTACRLVGLKLDITPI